MKKPIGQGAFQYSGEQLTRITAPSSLPNNTVLNFFEDREQTFWIGTQAGMLRLTRSQVTVIPLPQANDSDFGTIYQDRDSSFWIGSTQLLQMKEGKVIPRVLPGMGGVHVRNVYRDPSGVLWVGTDGNGVFRISPDRTTRLTSRDGLSNNFIRAMTQDHDRSMWIATDAGLNHILGEGANMRIISYQTRDGLSHSSIRALIEDARGDL